MIFENKIKLIILIMDQFIFSNNLFVSIFLPLYFLFLLLRNSQFNQFNFSMQKTIGF